MGIILDINIVIFGLFWWGKFFEVLELICLGKVEVYIF